MKQIRRIAAFILVLSIILSTVIYVPSQAASNNYWWAYSKCVSYYYNEGKWEKTSTSTNSYDKKGRTTVSTYKSENWSSKTKYSYNSKGYTTTNYENGKKTGKTVCTYNKDKKTIKSTKSYDTKGKLIYTITDTYDSKGNPTKIKTTYNEKGRKADVCTIKYTYKGKIITKQVIKNSDGSNQENVFSSKGIIKKSTYDSGDGQYKGISYYNSKGYIKKQVDITTIKDTNEVIKTTTIYKSKFDKNGNLTQLIAYIDDVPITKEEYSGYKKFKSTSSK